MEQKLVLEENTPIGAVARSNISTANSRWLLHIARQPIRLALCACCSSPVRGLS